MALLKSGQKRRLKEEGRWGDPEERDEEVRRGVHIFNAVGYFRWARDRRLQPGADIGAGACVFHSLLPGVQNQPRS